MYKTLLIIIAGGAAVAGAWYFIAPPREPADIPGTIEGTTLYPSEIVPAQIVCAELVSDPSKKFCTQTAEQSEGTTPAFHIAVPAGRYYVSATLKDAAAIGSDLGGYKAYYTQFVLCGLRYDCKDHAKLVVTVPAGQTVSGVEPHDWYMR